MRLKAGVVGVFAVVAGMQGLARAEEQNMSFWPIESQEEKLCLPHPMVSLPPAEPEKPKVRKAAPRRMRSKFPNA